MAITGCQLQNVTVDEGVTCQATAGGRRGRSGLPAVPHRSCRRRGSAQPADAADPATRTGSSRC